MDRRPKPKYRCKHCESVKEDVRYRYCVQCRRKYK